MAEFEQKEFICTKKILGKTVVGTHTLRAPPACLGRCTLLKWRLRRAPLVGLFGWLGATRLVTCTCGATCPRGFLSSILIDSLMRICECDTTFPHRKTMRIWTVRIDSFIFCLRLIRGRWHSAQVAAQRAHSRE